MKNVHIAIIAIALLAISDSAAPKSPLPSPAGSEISHQYASSEDVYYLCADGTAKVVYIISEYRNHHKYGIWKYRNKSISILWKWEKGERGLGKPVFCGSVCVYDQYQPFKRNISEKEKLPWEEVLFSEYREWRVVKYGGSCK